MDMKIKETYIIYSEQYQEYVKIHYCLNSTGSSQSYFMEHNNGVIRSLTAEVYDLLKNY
jgi:hypothetical protein